MDESRILITGKSIAWYRADAIISYLRNFGGHPITNTENDKKGVIEFLRTGNSKTLGNWEYLASTILRVNEFIEF